MQTAIYWGLLNVWGSINYAEFKSVLCVLFYRPPSYYKDFISNFSDFLSVIIPCSDNI